MKNVFNDMEIILAAVAALAEVGEKIGETGLMAVIGTAVDEFVSRQGLGRAEAKAMINKLLLTMDDVWEINGNFYGGKE